MRYTILIAMLLAALFSFAGMSCSSSGGDDDDDTGSIDSNKICLIESFADPAV